MAKTKTFEEIIADFNKDQKDDIITLGLPKYDYDKIPFTSPRLNYCTYGGIPTGKIVEFYGEQHGGKSTTALDLVANYQKMPNAREVLYCDIENALDRVWATKLGVDLSKVHILRQTTQSAEQIFQFIYDSVCSGQVGLVVIDSLGALVSQQAIEKELTEKTYAGISAALTNFSNKIVGPAQGNECTIIGINQMRDVLNSQFPLQNTPGGRAFKHICSVRMEFRKGKYIDANGKELPSTCENPAGGIVQLSVSKTRVFPPNRRTGTYTIHFLHGVDYLRDLFDLAIKYGAINQRGAYFDIMDLETGEVINTLQGSANAIDFLKNNEEVMKKLEKQVMKAMENE